MLYLSDAEVTQLIGDDMPHVVDLMRQMFEVMAQGDYVLGGENGASHGMRITRGEGDKQRIFIAMPGYLGGNFNITGMKWHGPNIPLPEQNADSQYSVIINDADNGIPLAMMRADNLTRFRTAGVNSLAVETLLKTDNPETISIIGPGRINRFTSKYLLKKYPSLKKMKIKGRGIPSRDKFIKELQNEFNSVDFVCCDTVKDAVVDADIILVNEGLIFDSYADMPRIKASWINEKSLFICSAYVTFPDSVIVNNSVKVCDMYKAYEAYEIELGYPAFRSYGALGNRFTDLVIEKKLHREDMIDLADLLTGKVTIRKEGAEPVLFTNCGIVLEDIALAASVYKKALEQKIGTEVE